MQKLDNNLSHLVKTLQNKSLHIDIIVFVKNFEKAINLFNLKNYKIKAVFPFINAICLEIDLQELQELKAINNVVFISSQTTVFAQSSIAKKIINVNQFYSAGLFGAGVTVAIIDTGVHPHLDFLYPKNRIIKFVDFIKRNINKEIKNSNSFFVNDTASFYDDNGHGTFVAGLVGGNGIMSGKKYCGIAPMCNLIILKALDKDGQSTSVEMLEAMQWVFDNKEKYNIKVVCMSFGAVPTSKSDPLMKGAERLWDSGIAVVAAGGNSGPEKQTIKSPGACRKIITVGALDDARDENENYYKEKFKIADFSSRGPAFEFYKPDLIVSGVNIISCGCLSNYTQMSGTSVSAPIVAGICALIFEKYNFHISPNQIKTLLQYFCTPIVNNRNVEGFGYLHFDK